MKKLILTLMILTVLACPAMGQRYRQMQLTIVDEFGDPVTNIDQIEIYNAGTAVEKTIYPTRAGGTMTNPITTGSTASTFSQSLGLVTWFQAAASYKVTIVEDGASQSLTIDNITSSVVRFPWYVNYIGEAATLQVTDDTTLDFGTSDDFYFDWDVGNTKLVMAPAGDAYRWDIGIAAVHTDIYWHTGAAITSDYVLFDEGSAVVDFIDVDLMMDDEAVMYFGSGDDVSIDYDSANDDLVVLSSGDLDLIIWGASTTGFDQQWFGAAAGDSILLDVSENELYFTDIDIMLDDDADLIFGDGEDWVIDSKVAYTLQLTPLGDETQAKIIVGATTAGSDLKVWGTTGSDYMEWDASADLFTIVGDEVALTLSGAGTNAFDLNCSGGLDIEAVGGATLDITAATDVTGGFTVTTNLPTGLQLGGSVSGLAHIEGTTDSTVAGVHGTTELDASSAPVGIVCGLRATVDETGADMTGGVVTGLLVETFCDDGGVDPTAHYMMYFNTSAAAETPGFWFRSTSPKSIAYTAVAGTAIGVKRGAIKVSIGGASGLPAGVGYIRVWDAVN